MQKTGAGLHTASSCYWDNSTDGQYLVVYSETSGHKCPLLVRCPAGSTCTWHLEQPEGVLASGYAAPSLPLLPIVTTYIHIYNLLLFMGLKYMYV